MLRVSAGLSPLRASFMESDACCISNSVSTAGLSAVCRHQMRQVNTWRPNLTSACAHAADHLIYKLIVACGSAVHLLLCLVSAWLAACRALERQHLQPSAVTDVRCWLVEWIAYEIVLTAAVDSSKAACPVASP